MKKLHDKHRKKNIQIGSMEESSPQNQNPKITQMLTLSHRELEITLTAVLRDTVRMMDRKQEVLGKLGKECLVLLPTGKLRGTILLVSLSGTLQIELVFQVLRVKVKDLSVFRRGGG